MSTKQDIAKLNKKFDRIKKQMASKENMTKYALYTITLILKRTKLGYGVDKTGGSKSKFIKLSDSYKKQRKKMKLDSSTKASKSNLTKTGDMLRDIKILKFTKNSIKIGFRGFSKKKARWVSGRRPFINVSKIEENRIKKMIKEDILRLFNK